jgi:dephospho-CoA kinase
VPVIGLVGAIGAGKSHVAACLARKGALILDADAIGHVLLEQSPSRDRVLERFGAGILAARSDENPTADPPIDRRALGRIVFADPQSLSDLEAILHPVMRKTFERAIAREGRRERVPAVVLDAAVLYEAEWDSLCDTIVYVDASRPTRLARLAASRGWTSEVLEARERAQWPADRKKQSADFILVNEAESPADPESTALVDTLWPRLLLIPRRSDPARERY